jgi:hypothetical protein
LEELRGSSTRLIVGFRAREQRGRARTKGERSEGEMKLMKGKGRRELVKPALFFSIAADGERFDGGGLAENEQ